MLLQRFFGFQPAERTRRRLPADAIPFAEGRAVGKHFPHIIVASVAGMRVLAPMTAKEEGQPLPQVPGLTHVEGDFSVEEVNHIHAWLLGRLLTEFDRNLPPCHLGRAFNQLTSRQTL